MEEPIITQEPEPEVKVAEPQMVNAEEEAVEVVPVSEEELKAVLYEHSDIKEHRESTANKNIEENHFIPTAVQEQADIK